MAPELDSSFETKPAWSIAGFGRDFDTSNSEIYNLIGRGQLVAVKAGRKTLITGDSVRAWWASLPPAKIRAADLPPDATGPPNADDSIGVPKTHGFSQTVPA